MKFRYYALGAALLASGVFAAGFGAVLKSQMPDESAFLYEEHSLIALPFALLADGKLDDVLAAQAADATETTAVVSDTLADRREQTELAEDTACQTTSAGVSDETVQTTAPPTDPQETTLPPETDASEPSVSLEECYPVIPEPVVGPEYFDNTLFIGDSRLCGLRDYARLGSADYFCDVGMTIFDIWESKCSDYDFGAMRLFDLLQLVKYDKIYIVLGINECGYPMNNFMNEYQLLIENLRDFQPDATIVLHGIMSVTEEYSVKQNYFHPDYIASRNDYIASLADGERIFYIDPNTVFTDSNGYLMTTITSDGCHLYAKETSLWAQWLQSCPPIM